MDCYRVGSFKTIGNSVLVQTYSRAPWNTDLAAILSQVTTRPVREIARDQDETGRYRVRFGLDPESLTHVQGLLTAHQAPTVTMVTEADLAVALDFYNVPRGGGVFTATQAGDLLNRAKYPRDTLDKDASIEQVASNGQRLALDHPLLRRSDCVVAMPGHGSGAAKPDSVPSAMASAICAGLGTGVGTLVRLRDVPERKNDRAADIRGSMLAVDVAAKRVLVVDDAVRDGTTITEACRALREAGAARVYVLVAAKDWTGTNGYRPEDL